jgi:hypothetical protein
MLRPDGDLLKEAMRESWELAAGGVQQWVAQLSVCLSNAGEHAGMGPGGGGHRPTDLARPGQLLVSCLDIRNTSLEMAEDREAEFT